MTKFLIDESGAPSWPSLYLMQVPPQGGQIISQESELSRVSCPKSSSPLLQCLLHHYNGNVTNVAMQVTQLGVQIWNLITKFCNKSENAYLNETLPEAQLTWSMFL